MKKPKYGINDVLAPVLDDTGLVKLHVISVKTLEMSTGYEISYQCRVYTTRFKGTPPTLPSTLFEFSEFEVKAYEGAVE